jgi:hypothetical protein
MILNNVTLHIYNIYDQILQLYPYFILFFCFILPLGFPIYYNSIYLDFNKFTFIHFAYKGVKGVIEKAVKYAPLLTGVSVYANTVHNWNNNKPNKDGSNNSNNGGTSSHTPNLNSKYSENSFFLAAVLSFLNINIPENSPPFLEFSFAIFTISIIALFCFMNTVFYLTALLLVSKYDIEVIFSEYPKLIKYIKYFSKATYLYIFIEALACFISLLVLVIGSLVIIYAVLN